MRGRARVKWSAVELKSPRFSPLKSLKGHKLTKATVSMATTALRGRMPPSWRRLKTPGSLQGQRKKKNVSPCLPPVTPSKHCRTRETFCSGCGCTFEKKKNAPVMIEHRKPSGRPAGSSADFHTMCFLCWVLVFSAGSFPLGSHEEYHAAYNSMH